MSDLKYIVLDLDTGVDDAWGVYMLTSLKHPSTKILGITCVNGNTTVDNVCKNTLYMLAACNQTKIPVYRGADQPLVPTVHELPDDLRHFHGVNGFGDVQLPHIDTPPIQEENAIVAMNRMVQEHKGEVTLVCFGPLTNVALAIRTYSDFAANVKEVFSMGGNYTGLGNTTMAAEFNFHTDPEAAQIVLSAMEGKFTLLPWETCYQMTVPRTFRYKIGESKNKIIQLLNEIERPIMERGERLGYTKYISCDQLLAAIIINRGLITNTLSEHAVVELAGFYTRGQIVLDHLKTKAHNITIIQKVDQDAFLDMIKKLAS